jgi:very-short-patch-repair endonuclease
LQERGYTVIRFTNEQILCQLDAVLDEIVRQCDNLA